MVPTTTTAPATTRVADLQREAHEARLARFARRAGPAAAPRFKISAFRSYPKPRSAPGHSS